MGNANGGQQHHSGGASDELSETSSRNPLQPNSLSSSRAHANASRTPKANTTGGNNTNKTTSTADGGNGRRASNGDDGDTENDDDADNRTNFSANFSVPQPPQPPPALQSVQLGTGTDSARARRVSVAINSEEDPPHQTPQRLAGFHRLSTADSLGGSNNGSYASHASSLNGKPRLTLAEARELLLSIFFPRQGQLECIASGFLTYEHYAIMRGFWAPFLTTELRDKWYLDAVMLSVLGKDRWRSSRQQKEIIMSVAPSREQVLQLNQQRQEYTDQLRERLLDLCGSLVESQEHHAKKTNLQALLEEYNRHKKTHAGNSAGGGGDGDHERPLSRTSSEVTSSTQHQELLSLSLMRLQTTVSTSFDCFELLANRIPTSVISSLPSNYFLNSTPVVYDAIAFEEKKVGDLDTMSFFMSLESRRRLLNGQHPTEDGEGPLNTSLSEFGTAPSSHVFDPNPADGTIGSARQLYSAVRHAGLVVTTACSSLVLTVMFQLAEVLRARQAFRDNRSKAAQKGITLEQVVGRKEATLRPYCGKPTENLAELKLSAITDETSLVVLTKALVERFKKENRAKVEKLRKRFPNLFAYLEAIAPPEEQEDFDATRLLSGMVLKLMFLTGGGQRSIVADDLRVPGGVQQITDDVALSNMLEVPILNRICWVACMMGMPIMSSHGILTQKHQGKPLTYIELDECCGVMRSLFQAVGALPCGNACPHAFKEWFPLFPFYAVNAEGKRVLTYLYMAQVSAIQRVPLTIQKDMTLLSFATALQSAKGQGRVDIANYFFEPTLTVGYTDRDKEGELNSMNASAAPALRASTTTTGVASPFAPKSIAGTLAASSNGAAAVGGGGGGGGSRRSVDSARSDRASPLSTSANGNAAAAKVMPASLNPAAMAGGPGSPPADAKFQYMTAVNVGSPTSATASKSAPRQAGSASPSSLTGAPKNSLLENQLSSSSSSSASLSCSTLLEDDRDIDVYTCVNPQTQLYMRCSNEATLRRHRATELTPSVVATFLHSQHEVQSKRPDIAAALHQAVPKPLPSEGFLVVRWTSSEPLVTFCAGDIVSVMAERTSSSSSSSGDGGGGASNGNAKSNTGSAGSPGSGQQPRASSARYFTGATRPSLDGTNAGENSATLKGMSLTATSNPEDSSARMPSSSPRVHTVTIDDSMLQDNTPRGNALSLSDRTGGMSPSDHMSSGNTNLNGGDAPFSNGNNNADDDMVSSASSSYNAPEKTRTYQGLMHELLGVKEKVSRRVAVRWNVVEVLPSAQLAHRTRRLSTTANGGSGAANGKSGESYRNEVVLHVAAPEMPVSFPLKILTIGHERAAMSVFTFVSPDSDAVCWANPRLVEAIVNRNEGGGSGSGSGPGNHGAAANCTDGGAGSGSFLQASGTAAAAKGPNGILCNTEEELHNVFFSIGVLLSNAIVNGVYFSAPIAPLAFLLMQKALNTGDYSFKSFMWLEPADGNLLNPALVLNSAYEILTMSEQQYVAFLQSRGMADGDHLVFPVVHSLLDEMKEDKVWQSSSTQQAQDESRRSQSRSQGPSGRPARTNGSVETASLSVTANARERSLNASRASSSSMEYLKLIHLHNRRGSTFRRSEASAPNKAKPHTFLMSANVPVQDRLQGYRNQPQNRDGPPLTSDAPNMDAVYAKLPSRREYLFLYLVNDLAWGSVRRDGVGEKNKELWVSMARGFMTSAVAKSPLMTNCCSRIIREVLCVPRPET